MSIVGVVFLIVAIVLFFVQRIEKNKLKSLRIASDTTVASLQNIANQVAAEIGGGSLRDYVKMRGVISCENPLISQLKQEPCVYYTMSVVREYEEEVTREDSEGKTVRETKRGSETVAQNTRSTPFMLEDSTGRILVNPQGADIETVKVVEEFRTETGYGGGISFGGFSLSLSPLGGGRRTIGYRYTESILPLNRQVFVLGTATDEDKSLSIRKPTEGGKRFIISLKSEEELAQGAINTAKWTFYGMIFCFVLGLILLIAGLL